MNPIKYAVIQSGYAVFGVGNTEREAIDDATIGMDDGMTADEVLALIKPRHNHVDGDFILMGSDDEDFDSYMENNGGFFKRNGEWFEV